MIVINLFGCPGAEKSTGAAYIFAKLKMNGVNAELVGEFAKDKVWEENVIAFQNQAYLFGEQSYRLSRCRDKVDVIVTDSPLPLSIVYNTSSYLGDNFEYSVMDVFRSYENLNYLVKRVKPYNPVGRHESEEESNALLDKIERIMERYSIDYRVVNGDEKGYCDIIEEILAILKEEQEENKI